MTEKAVPLIYITFSFTAKSQKSNSKLVSGRKVSKEPGRNFPPSYGNLSCSSMLSAIARNSGVFRQNECLREGRSVRFRKAPARLSLKMMEFPDGNCLSQSLNHKRLGR